MPNSQVPDGLWTIYGTRTECCENNFPYSASCDIQLASAEPTKHPSFAPSHDVFYDIVPIEFHIMGLPDDVDRRKLKDEMTTVFKRILLRLADQIPGLKISEIEAKLVTPRNLLSGFIRGLEQTATLYFDVYVVRVEGVAFGPLIIQEITERYNEIVDHIQ